jgi:Protein of unknown function (DUF4242)
VLYTAKCYWPGVTPTDLAQLAARAQEASAAALPEVAYLGSLWFVDDDLVLCLFEGHSRAAVQQAGERARIPFERLMTSAWLDSVATLPFNATATPPPAPPPKQTGDQQCTDEP